MPSAARRHCGDRRSARWRTYPADVLPLTVAEMDFPLAPPIADALRAAVDASDTGYSAARARARRAVSGVRGPALGLARSTRRRHRGHRRRRRRGRAAAAADPARATWWRSARRSTRRSSTGCRRPAAASSRSRSRTPRDGWRLDLAALEAAFATHPAVYLLCNPHNPVGRVHTRDELAALVRLAGLYRRRRSSATRSTRRWCCPAPRSPRCSPCPARPAWRSAWSPPARRSTWPASSAPPWSPPRPAMAAGGRPLPAGRPLAHRPPRRHRHVAALRDGDAWLDELLATLDARRTQLGELLRDRLPGIRWHPPRGDVPGLAGLLGARPRRPSRASCS